jgi:hypothetical protein
LGASHHTTQLVGNISNPRLLNSASPPSIVVGNGSTLPVTSVGDSVIPGPFYLNNILLAPGIVQNLLSVHRFFTNNRCSMKFDHFDLSVNDLTTRNVIGRSNSIGPLYTLRLPSPTASSCTSPCAMSTIATHHILAAVATSTLHRRLGHLGPDALSSLSRSSFISCTSTTHDFCHACQLGKHTRLPFSSSSSRAEKAFDLLHLDLWTSLIISVSSSKYYLIILDDFTHYLWTFPLKQNLTPSPPCPFFFAYVATQFSCTVKAIQCNATIDESLTTHPPRPSSCPKAPNCGCRAPTRRGSDTVYLLFYIDNIILTASSMELLRVPLPPSAHLHA